MTAPLRQHPCEGGSPALSMTCRSNFRPSSTLACPVQPRRLTRVEHDVQVKLLLQQQQAVVREGAHVAQADHLEQPVHVWAAGGGDRQAGAGVGERGGRASGPCCTRRGTAASRGQQRGWRPAAQQAPSRPQQAQQASAGAAHPRRTRWRCRAAQTPRRRARRRPTRASRRPPSQTRTAARPADRARETGAQASGLGVVERAGTACAGPTAGGACNSHGEPSLPAESGSCTALSPAKPCSCGSSTPPAAPTQRRRPARPTPSLPQAGGPAARASAAGGRATWRACRAPGAAGSRPAWRV